MKKIISILIFLFAVNYSFLIENCLCQWYYQSLPSYYDVADIKFFDENTGLMIFSYTYTGMLRTTNGGNNWTLIHPALTFYQLDKIDSSALYVNCRYHGANRIYRTYDRGLTWDSVSITSGETFYGLSFVNRDTGWICGSGSLIFKTTNGGVSFDSVNIPVGYLYDIYFRNANEGLVCGEAATMYKTIDGGANWQEIPMVPNGLPLSNLYRMTFVNSNTGYTQGVYTNKVFRTTNFGSTWDSIASVYGADASYSIFFPNEMTGWCAGTYGLMFKTTNGGYNWQPETVPQINQAYIRALYFIDQYTGWAVGAATKIFYTSNGGSTFVNSESEIVTDFKLYQNYPNPFNSNTIINFDIIKQGDYNLEIVNSLGQVIEKHNYSSLKMGNHKISFNGSRHGGSSTLSSGVYYYRLTGNNNSVTKTMVLIK